MPIHRIRILIQMVYAAAVVLCAILWDRAILVGMAYVFLRPDAGAGRQRNRNRDRA